MPAWHIHIFITSVHFRPMKSPDCIKSPKLITDKQLTQNLQSQCFQMKWKKKMPSCNRSYCLRSGANSARYVPWVTQHTADFWVSACCMSPSVFPSSFFPLHCPCSVLLSASLIFSISWPYSLSLDVFFSPVHIYTLTLFLFAFHSLSLSSFPAPAPSISLTFCTKGITCFKAFKWRQCIVPSELHQTG